MAPLNFNQICWLDLETTGLEPGQHDITQIALILDIDGHKVAEHNWTVQPHRGRMVSPGALKIQGRTMDQIRGFRPPADIYPEVIRALDAHATPGEGRWIIAGYNVRFDWEFLKSWITLETGDDYAFWRRFYGHVICCRQTVVEAGVSGVLPRVINLKLATVAAALEFHEHAEGAHDALADIRATREIYWALRWKMVRTAEARAI